MSIYRQPDGEQLVVCDGCGIAQDGSRPEVAALVKVDLTAEMRRAGFPEGTELNVRDYCPACDRARGKGKP